MGVLLYFVMLFGFLTVISMLINDYNIELGSILYFLSNYFLPECFRGNSLKDIYFLNTIAISS
jgi:hypothetical protein